MGGSSHSRRKRKIEPYNDLSELLDSPSLKGLVSFLDIPPEEVSGQQAQNESPPLQETDASSNTPTVPTPVNTGGIVSTPVDTINPVFTPVFTAVNTLASTDNTASMIVPALVEIGQSESTPVNIWRIEQTPVETICTVSTPVESPAPVFTRVETTNRHGKAESIALGDSLLNVDQKKFLASIKKRLFRPNRPSDAHTDGEDRLYQFMWENGQRHNRGVRLFAGSMALLGRAIGRDPRNTRPLIETLVRKLSIQIAREENFATRQPRVYFVFDYSEIAQRRRRAGLEWAVKNKGIQLLTAEQAASMIQSDLVSTPVDTSGIELTPVDTTPSLSTPVKRRNSPVSTPVQRPESTRVHCPVSTAVNTASPPYRRNQFENPTGETTPSTIVAAVVAVLRNCLGEADDDLAKRIVAGCQAVASDATADEISHFIRFDAALFRRGNINNPAGFLVRQVPRHFEGESFRQFREEEHRRREAERKRHELEEQELRRIEEEFRRMAADEALPEEER
jgi:hypothetical protein